jgi:ribosomal protein L22
MAEEKKDTQAKKPASKKAPAKKPAARKPPATKAEAKSEAKPKTAAKPRAESKAKSAAKPKAETKAKGAAKPKTGAKAAPKTEQKEAPSRLVVRASARFVRVAPRKARLVANQVRGLPIDDARSLLRFSQRGAAGDIRKLIDSAAANAENNHDLVADDLLVKEINVDEGPTLRRYRPRALGRATRINKRTSHIAVALTPED